MDQLIFDLNHAAPMNIKKIIQDCLFYTMVIFCNSLAAQVPVDEEPHHKVLFENEYVRLIDGYIPFHDTTWLHTHTINSVIVFLSQSIFGIQNVGEKPVVTEVKPGDMVYRAYGDNRVNHTVWDQGKRPFHFMVAELLRQHSGDGGCPNLSGASIKKQWQAVMVSAYTVAVTNGQHFHLPKSNCARLLIGISGVITTGTASGPHTLRAGDDVFFPPQNNIDIRGNNKRTAACVLLELK